VIFTLEALQADHGDALLLHYGAKASPGLVVIDGGPAGIYHEVLKGRLTTLKTFQPAGQRLPIRMVMVSHIDDDHIHGILDMMSELVDAQQRGADLPYEVQTLWHNSFKALVKDDVQKLSASLGPASIHAAATGGVVPPDLPLSREGALVLASVGQGDQLRQAAERLGLATNDPLGELVTAPAKGRNEVDLDDGLSFVVVGPGQARVDALRATWEKEIKKLKVPKKTKAADFVDTSVYNLSSIVVLAQAGKRRMLLTGDARGDFILEGLKSAGLLKDGTIKVDLLKLPHHGSIRDVAPEFFREVVADHYVISANGKFDNPDVATLKILTEARGGDSYTIYLTNAVPFAVEFFQADRAKNAGRQYQVVIRDPAAPSVKIDLGEPFRR
jgi:hypothetical protein